MVAKSRQPLTKFTHMVGGWPASMVYIYVYMEAGVPFYVGATSNVKKRLVFHLQPTKQNKGRDVRRRIQETQAASRFSQCVLEEIVYHKGSDEGRFKWRQRERYWVKELKRRGHVLLNTTAGGDGCPFPVSEETRAKLRIVTSKPRGKYVISEDKKEGYRLRMAYAESVRKKNCLLRKEKRLLEEQERGNREVSTRQKRLL